MVKASRGRWSARGGMARRGSFGRVKWSTHWRPHRLLPLLLLSRVFSFLRQLLFAGVSSTLVRRASRPRDRPSIDPNRSFKSLTKPDWSAFDDGWNTGQPFLALSHDGHARSTNVSRSTRYCTQMANGFIRRRYGSSKKSSDERSTTNPTTNHSGHRYGFVSYANSCTDTIKETEVERRFVLGELFGALEIRTTIPP